MSVLFDDALYQYLEASAPVGTGPSMAFGCWVKSNDATLSQRLWSTGDTGGDSYELSVSLAGNEAGDPVYVTVRAGSNVSAVSTAGYSVDTWHYVLGVFVSATGRAAYIDDADSEGINTASRTATGLDTTRLGSMVRSTPGNFLSGRMEHPTIWAGTLPTYDDLAALAAGADPTTIQPDSIVFYASLYDDLTVQIGDYTLTAVNGPSIDGDHAPVDFGTQISVTDTAAGTDALDQITVSLTSADAGAGADSLTGAAGLALADTAAGADLLGQLLASLAASDSAAGTDSLAQLLAQFALTDAGAGADSPQALVQLAITDLSGGVDAISVLATTLKIVSDLAAGTDLVGQVTVSVPLSDAVAGADAISRLLVALATADLGAGVDAVIRIDAATRIAMITFTLRRRQIAFSLAARQIDFSLATRAVTFGLAQRSMEFSLATRSMEFEIS